MSPSVKHAIFLAGFLTISLCIAAQTDTTVLRNFNPEFRRLINHEAIDREQKGLMASDGRVDNEFVVSPNEEINFLLTRLLKKYGNIDDLQYRIETDSLLDHRLKVNYLSGLANMLHYIR